MVQIRIKPLEILIAVSIILSPLYVVRLNLFGLPITLLEIILLATFAVWLWQRKSIIPPFSFLSWPIAMLILGVIAAAVVSPDQRGALGILKAYFLEPILFFYLLIDIDIREQNIGSDPKKGSDPMSGRRSTIVFSLIVIGLYLSIWGILQAVFGFGVVTPHEQLANRAHGPFNSGNALALFLGPVFLLVFIRTFFFIRRDLANSQGLSLRTFLFFLISLAILLGILLTKSQGALAGLVAAGALAGFIWLVAKTRWRLWLKYLWLVIPIYLIIVIGGLTQISRFTPKNNNPWIRPINDTLTPRLCLWEGAVNLLRERPLLGAGLNGFKSLYFQKYFTCDAEPLQYPHNFILNFWAELGLLGVLGIFLMLTMLLQRQTQIFLQPQTAQSKFLALSLLAIVFYWLIHGLVDVPYFKNDLSLQFWIIMALGILNFSSVRYTDSSD